VDIFEAVIDGCLESLEVRWSPQPAVCVVMASEGYPEKYKEGCVIAGLEDAAAIHGITVFHAGTRKIEHRTVTHGGRVLAVTALGADLADARRRAYQGVQAIRFDGAHYRRDIGLRAVDTSTESPRDRMITKTEAFQ
jgi:phosphoribosylamine--glycine ligase